MKNNYRLYVDLLKITLTNYVYGEYETGGVILMRNQAVRILDWLLDTCNLALVNKRPFDETKRIIGHDWPIFAHTMIGIKGLDNIEYCLKEIVKNGVKGDVIEAGVWRGGASIFMRGVLKALGDNKRVVWVADSFQGLPVPNRAKYDADVNMDLHKLGFLAVPLEQVKKNFNKYGLLDSQVGFLKGWFRDTLPKSSIKNLALIRCDGDMYESTMDVLTNLYPKLSKGGFVIIDDYQSVPACKLAVSDFRKANGITEIVKNVQTGAIYWRKTR